MVQIRGGVATDAAEISALLSTLADRFIVTEFSEEGRRNLLNSMTPAAIEQFFADGYRYHVAVDGGEIVGVVGTRDNSHLFHLFVAESYQGQGLSSRLWHVGRDACLDAGNPGFFNVNASLNAQNVYRRWGFEPIAGVREGGGVRDLPMRMALS